jgi:hypothetical protein
MILLPLFTVYFRDSSRLGGDSVVFSGWPLI